MAFPRSQRFVEKETCAPPPTAYYLPSVFDENNCSTWAKPCTFEHRCGQCLVYRKTNEQSMQSNNLNRTAVSPCISQHTSMPSFILDNKEAYSIQKKDVSNIPRFKKTINPKRIEAKAPSFMTRPRHTIHNCFATHSDETESSCSMSNFNRDSLKRKSIKLVKEAIEKSSKDFDNTLSPFKVLITSNLQETKHLNVSYVIRGKESGKLQDDNNTYDIPTASNTSAIPKRLSNITDDMKESRSTKNLLTRFTEDNNCDGQEQPNSNLEVSGSVEKEILDKDDSLHRDFLNNLGDAMLSNTLKDVASVNTVTLSEKLVEETTRKGKTQLDNAMKTQMDIEGKRASLRSCDSSPGVDNHVVFLISDEFIDDDYDSYVENTTLEKLYKIKDVDVLQIYNNLIRMNTIKPLVVSKRKKTSKVKRGALNKVKKNSSMDIQKSLRKKRSISRDIWIEVEKIVRAAIADLKGEFKNEIYRKTEEKVDTLMTKLAQVLLKAEESIESSCERTTGDLISKLKKIAN